MQQRQIMYTSLSFTFHLPIFFFTHHLFLLLLSFSSPLYTPSFYSSFLSPTPRTLSPHLSSLFTLPFSSASTDFLLHDYHHLLLLISSAVTPGVQRQPPLCVLNHSQADLPGRLLQSEPSSPSAECSQGGSGGSWSSRFLAAK